MVGKRMYYEEQIKLFDYDESKRDIANFVELHRTVQTSKNFRVAMNFLENKATNKNLVLFVICVHNHKHYSGFRINTHHFSAHPDEQEVFLLEDARVAIMG